MDTLVSKLNSLVGLLTKKEVSIRILVDVVRNKVLFVQAGKDFVDVLLSFLTLPLGTIARLVRQESNINNLSIGSISLLYESVSILEKDRFISDLDKELLVHPINSMFQYCRYLKLNVDDTEKVRWFRCTNLDCGGKISRRRNCKCISKKRYKLCEGVLPPDKGFVPETATFIISDDLSVKPDDSQSTVSLPKYLGCEDVDTIKIVTINVTHKKILDLVKCSLLSTTPLTDVFLSNKLNLQNAKPISSMDLDVSKFTAKLVRKTIQVKAMVRKSNNKILYALGEEDFADLVLSFLTFPLGAVENMLNGNSDIDGIDNLYKSMLALVPGRYLRSNDLVQKLDQSNFGKKIFTKSPSTYMVTDDLVVSPGSSTSAISFLTELQIPFSDLEEKVISIGNKEGLNLLKASLISSSALTDGLGPFIETKNTEKIISKLITPFMI